MLLSRFTRDEGLSMLRKRIDHFTWSFLTLAVPVTALVGWQALAQAPDNSFSAAEGKPAVKFECKGVSSCTAAACHNAGGPHGSKRSEYSTWFNKDPHLRAFAVLSEKRSQIMVRNYRGSGDLTLRAEEDGTCLKCHALAPEAAHTEEAYLNYDGVSCENCHGRAEKWLSVHYLPGWKDKKNKEKLLYGMTPTKDLVYRARQCAKCHIGSAENDLNHDLYAAGHPPFHYEFSAFLDKLPKHWSEREDKDRYADLELRAWALGQVVSAQAALELLVGRAGKPNSPWPEFAEYNCSACHHELQRDNRRRPLNHALGGVPGTLPWNPLFGGLIAISLEDRLPSQTLSELNSKLTDAKVSMQQPRPHRKRVATRASSLLQKLQTSLPSMESSSYGQEYADRLISLVLADTGNSNHGYAEEETQLYWGLRAAYRTKKALDPNYHDESVGRRLKEMECRLQLLR
jgi:hypothetical protein